MDPALRVVSVQVGSVRPVGGPGEPLRSAIDKRAVDGPRAVTRLGLAGDEIGHPTSHGGPDQALLFVAASSLATIAARLGRPLPPGSFGENVTLDGLDDAQVRIGDVFRWGSVELEVSSPRTPCEILARHLRMPDAVAVVSTPHRAGWYVRVLVPGTVAAGEPIALVRRGDAAGTVARVAAVRADEHDVAGAAALAALPGLSAKWRERFARRAGSRT